jgi:hypothetical protein
MCFYTSLWLCVIRETPVQTSAEAAILISSVASGKYQESNTDESSVPRPNPNIHHCALVVETASLNKTI